MIEIGETINGDKVVILPNIIFTNKQKIPWNDVERYLFKYVGEIINITDTNDVVYIGNVFPNEYTSSKYTRNLRGARAKAKANATQGIIEMIEIANNKNYKENNESKHNSDAKYGWYYYKTRFAMPIMNNEGQVVDYNVYTGNVVVNCASNKKLYLYDITDIKKEASNPLKSQDKW